MIKWFSSCLCRWALGGSLLLSLFSNSHAGYLGQNLRDPDQLVCIFPVNGGVARTSVTLHFNEPFVTLSSTNLLSGKHGEGYFVSPPVVNGSGSYVRISFSYFPVPVCLAFSGQRGNKWALQLTAANSSFNADNRFFRFTENTDSFGGIRRIARIALLHVDNTGNSAAAHSYLFAPSSGVREGRVYSLMTDETIRKEIDSYLSEPNRLSLPEQMLLAELNARYSTTRLSGVGEHLFRHLWFKDGVLQNALTALMMLPDKSGRLRGAVLSDNIEEALNSCLQSVNKEPKESHLERMSVWQRLLPHLAQASQEQANQLLAFLPLPAPEAAEGIEKYATDIEGYDAYNPDEAIADGLSVHFSHWDYQDPVSGIKYRCPGNDLLGKGGEGEVCRVIDDQGNEWALKKMNILSNWPHYQKSTNRLEALLRQNKLNSKHIARPVRSWTDGRSLFQLYPLYHDGDLDNVLRNNFKYIQEHLRELSSQVVYAIAALHMNGVVHRDIKPGNFLLDQGHVSLADLGFIREIETPDAMVMSLVGTPELFGPHTSEAHSSYGNYSPLIMDYETLAMTLFALSTGDYFLSDGLGPNNGLIDFFNYRRAIFNMISTGNGHQASNIKKRLKSIWAHAYQTTKYKVKSIPDPLLTFISELLAVKPSGPKDFSTLLTMMRENDYFQPFLKNSTEAQALIRSLNQKNDMQYNAIQDHFAPGMDVHWVAPDGNCLPAAVAGAINHTIPGREETQLSIRKALVKLFRSLVSFIQEMPNHSEQLNLRPEDAAFLQQALRIELASLTGISIEQMDNLPDDGSTEANGWLEPSLLVLLPLIGIDVDLYAPHHTEGLSAPMIRYNQQSWDQAPLLNFFLGEVPAREFIPPPSLSSHTITLIQNGAHGQFAEAGHYYYATEAERVSFPDQEIHPVFPDEALRQNPLVPAFHLLNMK